MASQKQVAGCPTMRALRKRGWSAAACTGVHLIKCLLPATQRAALPLILPPCTSGFLQEDAGGWSWVELPAPALPVSPARQAHTLEPLWQQQEQPPSGPCLWPAREGRRETAVPKELRVNKGQRDQRMLQK